MRTLHRIAVFVLLIAAAWPGPAVADFADGLAAYDAGDYAAAAAEWRPLAEAGGSTAQVALAGLYLAGHGVPADAAEAVRWYRRAAEAGDEMGQLNLGDAYARGIGVPRDPVSAYVWFTLAAADGRLWPARRRREVGVSLSPDQMAEAKARLAAWYSNH